MSFDRKVNRIKKKRRDESFELARPVMIIIIIKDHIHLVSNRSVRRGSFLQNFEIESS